jgi:hypothetical protein
MLLRCLKRFKELADVTIKGIINRDSVQKIEGD